MSTIELIIIKIKAIVITQPIITGISSSFKAFTISLPIPFQPKIYSTKTAPANKEANHPEIDVITGFNEFFKAWFFIIL
jgi:hypothetical protein